SACRPRWPGWDRLTGGLPDWMVILLPFSPKRATSPMRSTAWPAAVPLAMDELAPHVRSALFTPGTDADRLRKAVTVGAEVCIFDLEDSVPAGRIVEARETVRQAVEELAGTARIWLRVHPASSPQLL